MIRGRPPAIDADGEIWLRANWHLSIRELARHFGCSIATVWRYGQLLNLPPRPKPGRPPMLESPVAPTDQDRVVSRMLEGGCRRGTICEQLGISLDQYYQSRARLGLSAGVPAALLHKKSAMYVGGDTDCPLCICGARLSFRTNGFGATYSECGSCGQTAPIPLKGVRKHDQRERLEAELASLGLADPNRRYVAGAPPNLRVGKNDPLREVA